LILPLPIDELAVPYRSGWVLKQENFGIHGCLFFSCFRSVPSGIELGLLRRAEPAKDMHHMLECLANRR